MEDSNSKLMPSLLGGILIAILSATPLINWGNCFCCMWVMLGGGVAVYLFWKKSPPESELTGGDGAILGFLSGLFGALFGALLTYFFLVMLGFDLDHGFLREILNNLESIPPEVEEAVEEWNTDSGISPVFAVVNLFASLIINTIFGAIGGIITASILKNRKKDTVNNGWK